MASTSFKGEVLPARAYLAASSPHPGELAMKPNWGNGLPPGVLSLVSQLGGCEITKAMRGVNHTWKEEFELGITGITIKHHGPIPGPDLAHRYRNLTSIALGECCMHESRLAALAGLRNLTTLRLGTLLDPASYYGPPQLAQSLTTAGLRHILRLPLTSLNLAWCENLSDTSILYLRGLPLTSLTLQDCKISNSALAVLRNMPLATLNLKSCQSLTDPGLNHLKGLPLTDLNLGICVRLTASGLSILREFPLRRLVIEGWFDELTDAALENLRGLQLTSLDLSWTGISDAGLAVLRGMPLRNLNLVFCYDVTLAGLKRLRGLPLKRLNVHDSEPHEPGFLAAARKLVGGVLPADAVVTGDEVFEV